MLTTRSFLFPSALALTTDPFHSPSTNSRSALVPVSHYAVPRLIITAADSIHSRGSYRSGLILEVVTFGPSNKHIFGCGSPPDLPGLGEF
ncbi:hypothetical protein ZIOFF_009751 [Zingiber officinale]|uniref:Uncharacterized protein n=1 Tax=Zingiber officinale TaxID=94328 RepID=A0A8J5LXV4_ZINOF|nr:hypothetical protein ZIOFF_009751 [Zingiber officinale]